MRIIYFKKDEKHVLGRAGENGAAKICVDVTAWLHEFPSGSGALLYKRPDGLVYPLTTALDGGQLYAVLTSVDTAISGMCRVEAQWLDGTTVIKSAIYEGAVVASLGEAGSVPESSPSWVDDMTALGVTVAADKVQVAADKATVAADKEAVAADKATVAADKATVAADKVAALAAKADAQAAQAGAEGAYAAAVIARDATQAAKTDAQTAQAAAAQSATEASGSATAAQQTAAQIVTDEAARATAEQGRVSAEGTRQSAEQTRVSAESGRVTAEQGRVTAEQGRVTAEQERGTALAAHTGDTNNPHGVTADQTGAVSYDTDQTLTDAQKTRVRTDIGAADAAHYHAEIAQSDLPEVGIVGRVYATSGGFFVYTSLGYVQFTNATQNQYGARWDGGSACTMTRLGNAANMVAGAQVGNTAVQNDFDSVSPWADMFLCNMDNDGTVVARYGEPNFSQTGVVPPYAYKLPVMVAIPKFYYRVAFRNPGREIWISPDHLPGYTVHPAFVQPDGSEVDYRYIGAHLGGTETVDGVEMLTSASGDHAKCNIGRDGFRTLSRARGAGWQQADFFTWSALQMLFLVEYATTNSQAALGSGISSMPYNDMHVASAATTAGNTFTCTNAIAANFNVGDTIAIGASCGSYSVSGTPRTITAKTALDGGTDTAITFDGSAIDIAVGNVIWCCAQKAGGADVLGEKSGRADGTEARCQVSYRGVQGFHGNAYTNIDGVNIYDCSWYAALDPANWNDSSITEEDGYILLGTASGADGYVKSWLQSTAAPWAFITGEVGGGSTTFIPDYYYPYTGACALRVGGDSGDGSSDGAFCWDTSYAASDAVWLFGGRLRY